MPVRLTILTTILFTILSVQAETPLQLKAYKRYLSFKNHHLSVTLNLPKIMDLYHLTHSQVLISGRIDPSQIRYLSVAEQSLSFNPQTGKISPQKLAIEILPGINRLLVEGTYYQNSDAEIISRQYIDIYKPAPLVSMSDKIIIDTTLMAADGPYFVSRSVTIKKGATLTIEAGTTIFFAPETDLEVRGTLIAKGRKNRRIRFTAMLGKKETKWGGVHFNKSKSNNHLSFIDIEKGESKKGLVGIDKSNLILEHCTLGATLLRRVMAYSSSVKIDHCHFIETYPGDQAPLLSNQSEHLKGKFVPKGEKFILSNNIFGRVKGHNDVIDFSTISIIHVLPLIGSSIAKLTKKSRGEIPQFVGNVFLGGGDDGLDIDGSAIVESNLFMNFKRDKYNKSSGDAGVLSGGGYGKIVMKKNIFYNVDKIAATNRNTKIDFFNNTVVNVKTAAFSFYNSKKKFYRYGKGVKIRNSIFYNTPKLFKQTKKPFGIKINISINHSIVPQRYYSFGIQNFSSDPQFVSLENFDFSLRDSSMARQAGDDGQNIGAL